MLSWFIFFLVLLGFSGLVAMLEPVLRRLSPDRTEDGRRLFPDEDARPRK